MENNSKPTIEQILGHQVLKILYKNQISGLRIELDGTLSATYSTVEGLPVSKTLKNLRVEIDGQRIIINGDVTHTEVDEGKII